MIILIILFTILTILSGLAFWPNGKVVGLTGGIISAAFALMLFSASDGMARLAGLPPATGPAGVLVLTLLITAWRFYNKTLILWPAKYMLSSNDRYLSVAIAVFYCAPVIMAGGMMGIGDWPKIFFNVDSAYYMTQIQALVRFETIPPPNLNVFKEGAASAYHYGAQNMIALVSRITGIAAHQSAFLIVMPLLILAISAVSWRFSGWIQKRYKAPHWLSMLFLLFPFWLPVGNAVRKAVRWDTVGWGKALSGSLWALLKSGYPMMSSLAGMFALYLLLSGYFWLRREKLPTDLSGSRFSSIRNILLVGLMPWFKSAFLIPLGAIMGAMALQESCKKRSIMPLIAPAVALALAIAVKKLTVPGGQIEIVFGLHALSVNARDLFAALVLLLIYLSLIRRLGSKQGLAGIPWPLAAGFLVPIIASSLVYIEYIGMDGLKHESKDISQTLAYMPVLASIMFLVFAVQTWRNAGEDGKKRLKRIAKALAFLPLLRIAIALILMLAFPRKWHEYTDNTSMAMALKHIPVEGTVIATNDIRYPANKFKRPHKQAQIAAIFGHQAYMANANYEVSPQVMEKMRIQEKLQGGNWNRTMEEIARKEGWTHILIHKQAPYMRNIGGERVYENDRYTVYKLRYTSG